MRERKKAFLILGEKMKLVFLGPPGVGKGTIASMFRKKYGIETISSGDLLRENIKDGSELGREAKTYMDKGLLVPDELVIAMMKAKLGNMDNYILDGFPRTIAQAEELDKIENQEKLRFSGTQKSDDFHVVDKVVNFIADDKTIIKRLSGRRICPKCNTIYHITNIPTKVEGICDKDGTKLIQRDDDKPEAIKKRLVVYDKQTKPLIEYYNKKGILVDVDTEKDLDKIFEDTKEAVGIEE